jgi:hypothetical protein
MTKTAASHCPGCAESAKLRAQLAQRTAAIQEHLRLHDHHLNGEPDCLCVVCEILQPLRDALADLPASSGFAIMLGALDLGLCANPSCDCGYCPRNRGKVRMVGDA